MQASVMAVPMLQSTGSIVVAHGLGCSMACEIFPDQESICQSSALAANSLPLRHHGSIECLVLKIIVFSIPLLSTQEYNM